MTEFLTFSAEEVLPSRSGVLSLQGVPVGTAVREDIEEVLTQALDEFARLAETRGICEEIALADFEEVYSGEGRNETRTPVGDIFHRADRLALFAVTLGVPISRKIEACFEERDFALGSMLDSVASLAADAAAQRAEDWFVKTARSAIGAGADAAGLRYSPGYCGWHISGQKKLFAFLHPEQIGLSLRESFLMEPLKSVSGVIIVGPADIHDVPDSYPCCQRCNTHACRERIRSVLGDRRHG